MWCIKVKAIVQRVKNATVKIPDKNYTAEIGKGLLILLGIKEGDVDEDCDFVADKCSNLRIFEDENYKMNLSIRDIEGEALVISQFTLYGETARGNRPSFTEAAKPEIAISLYQKFIDRLKENIGDEKVKAGLFGAMMDIELINYGPVTIIVESKSK